MRTLVTGGGGFVGQWMARALLSRGDDVVLAGLGTPQESPHVLTPAEWQGVHWVTADIRREEDVHLMIDESWPSLVIHLAGISFVPHAEAAPAAAYDINVGGAARVLAELGRRRATGAIDPTVIIVGSGTQYGRHDPEDMPLTEDAEQRPLTVYAATKAAQELASLQTWRTTGLRVICTRSFNHSGIGHDESFLIPALVRRVRALKAEGGSTLLIGNEAVRDYLHVADVVRAYLLLAERGTPGEVYNVSSGIGLGSRQLAETVLQRAGVTAEISTDPTLVRAAEIPVLIGSPAKLVRATGWNPTRTHADIIDDLLHASKD